MRFFVSFAALLALTAGQFETSEFDSRAEQDNGSEFGFTENLTARQRKNENRKATIEAEDAEKFSPKKFIQMAEAEIRAANQTDSRLRNRKRETYKRIWGSYVGRNSSL